MDIIEAVKLAQAGTHKIRPKGSPTCGWAYRSSSGELRWEDAHNHALSLVVGSAVILAEWEAEPRMVEVDFIRAVAWMVRTGKGVGTLYIYRNSIYGGSRGSYSPPSFAEIAATYQIPYEPKETK